MQCFQIQVMCCWLRARLRDRGFPVGDDDLTLIDVLHPPELGSVADVILLDDTRLDEIARSLGYRQTLAA